MSVRMRGREAAHLWSLLQAVYIELLVHAPLCMCMSATPQYQVCMCLVMTRCMSRRCQRCLLSNQVQGPVAQLAECDAPGRHSQLHGA
jgi:hypothetical protein